MSDEPPPKPEEAPAKDTGLHISMRALLSIIAGLLVAEAVRVFVVSFTAGAISECQTWINAAIALAGTLFVTRVVTDNLLYYAERDIPTKDAHYVRRVVLIVLDLMSYALCYAIVARITVPAPGAKLTAGAVRWCVTYATLVEFLHAIWCRVALGMPNNNADDRKTREDWLRAWFRVSGGSFVLGVGLSVVAWCAFHPGFEAASGRLASTSLLVAFASTGVYVWRMSKHYSRLRTT